MYLQTLQHFEKYLKPDLDLNPPDTFLNSYLKKKVWEAGPVDSMDQLRARFFEEVAKVDLKEVQNSIENLRLRIKAVGYYAGGHFEKFIKTASVRRRLGCK